LNSEGIKETYYNDSIPSDAQKLIKYYSNFIKGFSNNQILFKNGSRLVWDDGIRNKSHKDLLDNPDIKDMFNQKYPIGRSDSPHFKNFDPGRVRNEQFFLKIYGFNQEEVKRNLTEIVWCPKLVGQKIMVTKINGIDKIIVQLSKELDEHPELKRYFSQIGGSFAWRNIKGSQRKSTHSFGMTIDINTIYSDFWQWDCKCTDENTNLKYKNKIPQVIVDIFEKYGFIWGGKWYHFDTMHFEYRPELTK
jgi:hypothetical protein